MNKEIYKFECTSIARCTNSSIFGGKRYCHDHKEESSSCSYKEIIYHYGCSEEGQDVMEVNCRHMRHKIDKRNPSGRVCVQSIQIACSARYVIGVPQEPQVPQVPQEPQVPELIKLESENAINEIEL